MNALTITTCDNEPRVLGVALAEQLGMAEPRAIRSNVIEPNREELESFGSLYAVHINPGPKGGAPASSIASTASRRSLVCILSRTERAMEVRAEVILKGPFVSAQKCESQSSGGSKPVPPCPALLARSEEASSTPDDTPSCAP
jgi:hypothetical protein